MSEIRERLERLTPAQRAEFERRARGTFAQPPPSRIPRRSNRLEPCPLSYAQQRLWFLDQVTPGNPFYLVAQAMRLRGKLRVGLLRAALQAVLARHESLRTAFVVDSDGLPRQSPATAAAMPFAVVDLTRAPPERRFTFAQSLAHAHAMRPFDLREPPLMRSLVLRLSPDEHVWVLSMHHIVSDAWSLDILLHEVAANYQAGLHRTAPTLPMLSVQYSDYAVWQRESLNTDEAAESLSYWCQRLANAPTLRLPLDHPRPRVAQYAGGSVRRGATKAVATAISRLSREAGVTLNMALLAAWKVLLARYSSQTDIVVGMPVANRTHPEVQNLIGFFVNALVIRTDLSDRLSFRELLIRVREAVVGALAHQDVPFDLIVEKLRPERDLSLNPIFQVEFQLHENAIARLALPGIETEPIPIEVTTSRFDMELHAYSHGEQLDFHLLYNASLFEQSTMERFLRHYVRLLEEATVDPHCPVDSLPLLEPFERQELLDGWNATARAWTDVEDGSPVAGMVEWQAAATPDRIAAVERDHHVSYAELVRRARQVAAELRNRGISAEDRVGVCLQRGVDLGVAVLGVLEAGAGYVPLDPSYPDARLSFMVADAQVACVISRRAIADRLGALKNRRQIDLDAMPWAPGGHGLPRTNVPAECLGYVIYTSGSTGKPKGIDMPQQALVNLLRWYAELLPAAQRSLQFTSISFDASFVDLFHTWSTGGTLVWTDESSVRDARALTDLIDAERVEFVMLPAMLLSPLVEHLGERRQALRDVISTAEPLYLTSSLREWFARNHCRLHNQCGPSETHVVTSCTLPGAPADWPEAPPIGRPIANTRLYVLDANLEPVPIGVVGELYVEGMCLARGYHGQPALTAERFVPSPFGASGGRMYRSGDRVRYRENGDIEFVERADDQVKIRGFRIELGEVQAALAARPEVAAAVVIARELRSGDTRLIAYVVPSREGAPPTAESLRRGLAERLPDYMLPAAFVALERLPVTPSGKVDRKALPPPEDRSDGVTAPFVAPRTRAEQRLAAIWAQVLGVERVGIDDDFFDLGGHSLLATQLVNRVRAEWHAPLKVRDVFERPTIRTLAGLLEAGEPSGLDGQAPIRAVGRDRPLPLSLAQQRIWFLEQLYPGKPTYNLPFSSRFEGRLDVAALRRAFTEIVTRHEVLRTTFHGTDGEPVQKVHAPTPFHLPLVDVSACESERREALVRRIVRTDASRAFDLRAGPLIRACLIRERDDSHVLVLTLHHLISDGWSNSLLMRELAALYTAFRAGLAPTLPPLPIQYADFSAWQREWLRGDEPRRQLEFWRQQLAGTSGVLNLPTDYPRPPTIAHRGAMEAIEVPETVGRLLQRRAREWKCTPFMLLLAAWQALLWRYSGDADLLVATPIAGRNRGDIEGLIGMFVNSLVMRTRFRPEWTFEDLLGHVRELSIQAHANQDVPFEWLVDQVRVRRDLSRTPLAQAEFVLQNMPREPLVLPDLVGTPIVEEIGVSRFDVSLEVVPRGDAFTATIAYSTDLFSRERIRRMLAHFEGLLRDALTEPARRLIDMPLAVDLDENAVAGQGRSGAESAIGQPPPDAQWLRHAAVAPERVAAVCGGEHITYGALERRAESLAARLCAAGATVDSVVAIHLPRSLDLIVAVLAALKCGAAHRVLDSAEPLERTLGRLAREHARVIVTNGFASSIGQSEAVAIVHVNQEAVPPTRIVTAAPRMAQLAVLWTEAAGVDVASTHGALMSGVEVLQQTQPLAECDVVAIAAPFERPIAVLCALWAMLSGARVAFSSSIDAAATADLLFRAVPGVALVPTRVLETCLAESLRPAGPPPKLVMCSGDVPTAELRRRAAAAYGEVAYVHCGHGLPAFLPSRGESGQRFPVVIGRPAPGVRARVLDRYGHVAPVGIRGELHLDGATSPREYAGRPSLTAERFVPDPWAAGEAGVRLFATGDVARHREDGSIEFLGRAEDCVVIDGVQICLLEIEAALAEHPDVAAAAVLTKRDAAGASQLVAYVVRSAGSAITAGQLLGFLDARLPAYMRPAAVVFVDRMPLTPHGDADKDALLSMPVNLDVQRRELREPIDEFEIRLCQLWSELLGVPVIDTRRSFFQLGGQSLVAVRLAARIEREFRVRVPVETLFLEPTIEGFARVLRTLNGDSLWRSLTPVQPHGRQRPLFCMPPLGFTVTQYRPLADRLGADQPLYACQCLPLHEWDDSLNLTLEKLADANIEGIRTVQPHGPYRLAGWSSGGTLAFAMAHQLRAAGEEVEVLALFDTWAPGSRPRQDAAEVLAKVVQAMTINFGSELLLEVETLRGLPAEQRLDYAIDEIIRAGLADAVLDRVRLRTAVNGLWGMQRLPNTYEPRPYEGPVLLFRAVRPSPRELQELLADGLHPAHPVSTYRGWDKWLTPLPEVCDIAASHTQIVLDPHVAHVAGRLGAALRGTQPISATAVSLGTIA